MHKPDNFLVFPYSYMRCRYNNSAFLSISASYYIKSRFVKGPDIQSIVISGRMLFYINTGAL